MSPITFLCVTHERPQWMPWLIRQVKKFDSLESHLVVVDSSEYRNKLFDLHPSERVTYLHHPDKPGIAVKRNIALAEVKTPLFAWFDDDDWSHPARIPACAYTLEADAGVCAAGSARGYKINARTLKARLERTVEPVIFNSAVYRTSYWQSVRFDERMPTGEDTEWQMRGFALGGWAARTESVFSSWLCHGDNITNSVNSLIFDVEAAELPMSLAELRKSPEYQG